MDAGASPLTALSCACDAEADPHNGLVMSTLTFEEVGLGPDWWPELLDWHFGEVISKHDRITLASVDQFRQTTKYRHIYTALGSPDDVDRLVRQLGFAGHDVDSNGPHPSASQRGQYRPSFWVFADGTVRLEPLVVRWHAAK